MQHNIVTIGICFFKAITILNFFYWLVASLVPSLKKSFVRKYLRANPNQLVRDSAEDPVALDRFISKTLRSDGVLVLRLVSDNAGDIVCTQIVGRLWQDAEKKTE